MVKYTGRIHIYAVAFENGFSLEFDPSSNAIGSEIRKSIEQKIEIQVTISKQKEPNSELDKIVKTLPLEIKEEKVRNELELNDLLLNPCRCHYGGVCICSQLPKDRGKTPPITHNINLPTDAVLALAFLNAHGSKNNACGSSCCSDGCSCSKDSCKCVEQR
jgi:hypothetical protein